MTQNYAIALHGGAGVNPDRDYGEVRDHLDALVRQCKLMLQLGKSALDVVEFGVADMEDSGLYVAGRGAGPNTDGRIECDAAIMDGARHLAGGVCALVGIVQPIGAARAVLEHSPYALLAGQGARSFALSHGASSVPDDKSYYRLPVGVRAEEMQKTNQPLSHGTVGAVALDANGRLAAATSTGGLFGKATGRVGDTPITGIGNWADQEVAISCTGIGEAFIYAGGARDVVARMRYGDESLEEAAGSMLNDVAMQRADGGLIAIDSRGKVIMQFNSPGMKRAAAGRNLETIVEIT